MIPDMNTLVAKRCTINLMYRAVDEVDVDSTHRGNCIILLRVARKYKAVHFPTPDKDVWTDEDYNQFYANAVLRKRVDDTAELYATILRGWIPREGQQYYPSYQMTGYYWPLSQEFREERKEALRIAGRILLAIERAEHAELN